MAFVKKEWADRLSEYPTRRRLINTSTSAEEIVTVQRYEGEVSQEGDAFNAANMNDLEDRIESAISSTESSLATVAISGSYNDLTNKPTIPAAQVQADWSVTSASSAAFIKNKPTIPAGTVTSVRVQATSPVTSSSSTAQTATLNTTIALANGYGDTKNPYASKTKNTVLAAGSSADSVPSFRKLVAADLPAIGSITNAGAITGTTALASGDGIIFADNSDSSKLKRSSITFDGSTTTSFLSKKGTWETPTSFSGIDTSNKVKELSSALKSSGTTTVSWTATQNCFIVWTGYSGSSSACYIDNVSVGGLTLIPVKSGSGVKKTCTDNNTSLSIGFIAYGVK